MIVQLQFHAKLSDALRAVQNLQIGEDPAKAEGGLTILDNFQQSIGESVPYLDVDDH